MDARSPSTNPPAPIGGGAGLADPARTAAIRRRLERQYVMCMPSNADELDEGLTHVEGNTDVVVDVSRLEPFGAEAVGCLARHLRRLEASTCSLAVVNPSTEARHTLADASLDQLLRRRRH